MLLETRRPYSILLQINPFSLSIILNISETPGGITGHIALEGSQRIVRSFRVAKKTRIDESDPGAGLCTPTPVLSGQILGRTQPMPNTL